VAGTVAGGKPFAVVRFLSDAWFDELGRALPSAGEGPADLTIQQVVTAAPEGEVRFHIEIRGDRLAMRRGQAGRPDATLTEDYATAAGIASGELSPQAALLDGLIRVAGNLAALLEHRTALAGLDSVPPGLRAATTY
jgi:alkyl sulfatase BDS1-like metallo-beta-lactamase superfamily hydrolase